MTRFKKELIKRGELLEETVPYLPYNYIDAIIVHADECKVSYYDIRIGWYWNYYDRTMKVYKQMWEEDDIPVFVESEVNNE